MNTTDYIPRRKYVDRACSTELFHSAKQHKNERDNLCLTVVLHRDDPINYLHWLDNLMESVETHHLPFFLLQLLPMDSSDDDAMQNYASSLAKTRYICTESYSINQHLNNELFDSIQNDSLKSLLDPTSLVCDNLEIIKLHFHSRLTPFFLLDLESKLDFDPNNVLLFLKNLDSLSKVYYYIFREPASPDLKIHWVLSALNKNYFLNKAVIDQIQIDWATIIKDPYHVRTILSHFLYRFKRDKLKYVMH